MSHVTTHTSYSGDRPDLRALIPAGARGLLDVGCYEGALGAAFSESRGGAGRVVGIEALPEAIDLARERLDHVIQGDADDPSTWDALGDEVFDAVTFGDVLEHCRDPWAVLRRAVTRLVPGGAVVISLPNVGHYSTLVALLRGTWPRRDRGIHDRTHLRWFGARDLAPLVEAAGLSIEEIRRNYRIIERPHPFNRWAHWFAVPGLRNLVTFQFLVLARKPGEGGGR